MRYHLSEYCSESLITYEQQEAFDKLNLAHESKQKDKEIVLLTAQAELQALQAEQRSLWLYIFIGGTVLMFVLLIIIYNRYKLKQKSVKIISNQKEDIERKNAENVTLIREIHHRVKNNLQIMYSLLNSQSNILKDDNAKIIIKESKDRIKSMALIHDHLYQSGSFVKVNAREYFQNLTDNIKTSFNSVDKKVHLNLDIPDTDIRLDMAVPLGLIVNELITNSYKYAFQNVSRGELQLHFERIEGTDSYQLEIADNGCGLPENFEIEKTESFGLQLVKGLTEQLGGTLKIINGVGTTFNIAVKNFEHV
ncbi:MAG: sensor histidine kinase [Bacteroidota bacterium]